MKKSGMIYFTLFVLATMMIIRILLHPQIFWFGCLRWAFANSPFCSVPYGCSLDSPEHWGRNEFGSLNDMVTLTISSDELDGGLFGGL